MTLEQLAIDEAVVWPAQSRLLETWASRLRQARRGFADDRADAGAGGIGGHGLP